MAQSPVSTSGRLFPANAGLTERAPVAMSSRGAESSSTFPSSFRTETFFSPLPLRYSGRSPVRFHLRHAQRGGRALAQLVHRRFHAAPEPVPFALAADYMRVERLGGDAPPVEAGPAEAVLLDQRHAHPRVRRQFRGAKPSRAAADDNQVVHALSPSLCGTKKGASHTRRAPL